MKKDKKIIASVLGDTQWLLRSFRGEGHMIRQNVESDAAPGNNLDLLEKSLEEGRSNSLIELTKDLYTLLDAIFEESHAYGGEIMRQLSLITLAGHEPNSNFNYLLLRQYLSSKAHNHIYYQSELLQSLNLATRSGAGSLALSKQQDAIKDELVRELVFKALQADRKKIESRIVEQPQQNDLTPVETDKMKLEVGEDHLDIKDSRYTYGQNGNYLVVDTEEGSYRCLETKVVIKTNKYKGKPLGYTCLSGPFVQIK